MVRVKFKDDFDIELESNLDYAILLESAKQLITRTERFKMHVQTIDASRKIYHDEFGWLSASDWLH